MEERLSKDEKKKLRHEEWEKQLSQDERKKKMNKILWWVGGLIVLGLSVWFIVAMVNTPSSPSSATMLTAPGPKNTDMTFGNPQAKVVLTEYADFQCPGCGAYYPIVKQLAQNYKDKVLFVYRFFPLTSIHQNALSSSEMAYAASKQGKFWEMHDTLFEHQTEWSELADPNTNYLSYAEKAGLNVDQLKKDYASPDTEKFVKAQQQAALDLGLPGTPSFFINGKQIQNPAGYDAFKKLIDDALAASK